MALRAPARGPEGASRDRAPHSLRIGLPGVGGALAPARDAPGHVRAHAVAAPGAERGRAGGSASLPPLGIHGRQALAPPASRRGSPVLRPPPALVPRSTRAREPPLQHSRGGAARGLAP